MTRLALMLLTSAFASPGWAQEQDAPSRRSWVEEKCVRYADAWEQALTLQGADGISPEFLARHDEFIAGGCTDQGKVCPRSPQELELANVLSIAAMNAGTASTFLPFGCRE